MFKVMKLKNRFICFIGVDGSGKSTLAERLSNDLTKEGYQVNLLWLRMNYIFTKPLLLFCRIVGLTSRPYVKGKRISIHEFYKSPLIAFLVRLLHSFDTLLHYLIKIYLPLKFSKKVILCDRFIYDVYIDFAIEGKKENIFDSLLFKLSKKFMLNGAVSLLILTPKEDIIHRRPDVLDFDLDYDQRFKEYIKLSKIAEVITIDNTKSLDFAYSQILDAVSNAKNLHWKKTQSFSS
jgi:thymidylate kinase